MVDGRVVGAGSARELSYWRSSGRFESSRVELALLPGPGTPGLLRFGRVELTTPSVTGDATEKSARAGAGVVARAEKGQTARAPVVVIDGPAQELSAPAGLDFAGEGQTLQATAAHGPLDGSKMTFVAVQGSLAAPGLGAKR